MSAQKQETIARVQAAINVLGNHIDIGSALKEMKRHGVVKEESYDALRNLLARSGKDAPGEYLGKQLIANRDFIDRKADNDEEDPDGPKTLEGGFDALAVANENVFREKRIFFIPDCHFPYVDREKFALAMRVARFFQPHRIVILGDWLDAFAVSFHSKSPARYHRLVDEVQDSSWGQDEVDAIGAEEVDFLEGNHSARLARMIEQQAPALHGLKGTTIEEILNLKERGWRHHKYMTELHIGKLRCCHDYGQAGKYSLGRAMATLDADVTQGHTHLAQIVHGVSRAGEDICGTSFGWLGSFDEITYTHRGIAMQQWAHGCGVGWTQPDGRVRREVVRLGNGKPTIEGQAC